MLNAEVLPQVVAVPENAGRAQLAGVLHAAGQALLVLAEVVEGGEVVRPPDVQDELHPAVERLPAPGHPALPPAHHRAVDQGQTDTLPVLIRPVGDVHHVGGGGLVEPVAGHVVLPVLVRTDLVLTGQVGGEAVCGPGHVLVTQLCKT